MSKRTIYLLGILTIIVGTFLHWKFCCSVHHGDKEEKTNKTVIIPELKKASLTPFGIKEVNDKLLLKMEENFNFSKSNFVISDDLPKDVNDGVLKIKEYLDADGQKRFNIIGYYTSDEENNSAYPNLGLARANAVKNYMASKGISTKLINTFGQLNENIDAASNKLIYKSIDFAIVDKDIETANKDEEALKADCEALKKNPLVLYFKTSQASIILSKDQKEKFAKISNCVDKLGATVKVIGHTDNTGNPDYNVVLGQERADFAKGYLTKNGIIKSKIKATSKGQTTPITTNETVQGRAKNRRTVITIN